MAVISTEGVGAAAAKKAAGTTTTTKTTTATPPAQFDATAGLPPPLTTKQLAAQATAQVNTDTAGQVDPLNTQIGTLNTEQKQAAGDITGMFNAIQPVVTQGATAVQQGYDAAQVAEQGIFTAANQRMNEMAQGQAQQAQMLSQQIGAPVAVDSFTQPYTTAAGELGALGAGQQLHTLAYAQAGDQEAQAFASQVFPLVRTEAQAQNRTTYQNQIKDLRSQIAKIVAQKGSLFDTKFSALQAQEKTYALSRAQIALDAHNALQAYNLKVQEDAEAKREADNNYTLQQQQNEIEQKKLDEQIAQDKITAANATRSLNIQQQSANTAAKSEAASETQAAAEEAHLTAQDKIEAKRLGLDERTFAFNKSQALKTAPYAIAKLKSDRAIEWNTLLENAVNPTPGKTVTISNEVPAQFGDPSAFYDKGRLVKIVNTTQLLPTHPMTNPTRVVDYLVNDGGMPKKQAIEAVKARFAALGLPASWKYGQQWPAKKPNPAAGTKRIPNPFTNQTNPFTGATG